MSSSAQDDCGHLALRRRYCSSYIAQPEPYPLDEASRTLNMYFRNSCPLLGHFSSTISIKMMNADVHTCKFVMVLCLCGVIVNNPPFTERSPFNWESVAKSFADLSKIFKSIYSPAQIFSLIFTGIWAPTESNTLDVYIGVTLSCTISKLRPCA